MHFQLENRHTLIPLKSTMQHHSRCFKPKNLSQEVTKGRGHQNYLSDQLAPKQSGWENSLIKVVSCLDSKTPSVHTMNLILTIFCKHKAWFNGPTETTLPNNEGKGIYRKV